MKCLVRLAITDAMQGEPHTLIGLIDWLLEEGVSLKRILDIAEKHFQIPRSVSLATLQQFV